MITYYTIVNKENKEEFTIKGERHIRYKNKSSLYKYYNIIEAAAPGIYEIGYVEITPEESVMHYIETHDRSVLNFGNIELQFEDSTPLNQIIISVLRTSVSTPSYLENGTRECRAGANRSSIDLWRHVKKYRDVSIFEVMRELAEFALNKRIGGLYCGNVRRRVFYFSRGWTSLSHESYKDEYGLSLYQWKRIGLEKQEAQSVTT